jgi:hypothetical protein
LDGDGEHEADLGFKFLQHCGRTAGDLGDGHWFLFVGTESVFGL